MDPEDYEDIIDDSDDIDTVEEEPIDSAEDLYYDEPEEVVDTESPKFGQREFEATKGENGYDRNYYKNKDEELQGKINEAQAEKERSWKQNPDLVNEKDDSNLDNNDNKDIDKKELNNENSDSNNTNKLDSNTDNDNKNNNLSNDIKNDEKKKNDNSNGMPEDKIPKTARDKLKDNINLQKAKYNKIQNKINDVKSKAYQASHPVEALKSKAKDSVKRGAKKAAKTTAKVAGKAALTGIKAIIAFLVSNPIALVILLALALILLLFFFIGGSNTQGDGYFDSACNFNLTTVILTECGSVTENNISLEDYVLGVTYAYDEELNLSRPQAQALMLIVKTNALATGGYSDSNKTVHLDTCNVKYENIDNGDSNKVNQLKDYYEDIETNLYVSESYEDNINYLDSADALEFNDNVVEQIVNNQGNYSSILSTIYNNNASSDANTVKEETVSSNRPFLFIGDSRTVGMDASVNELDSTNTIAQGSMAFPWFRDTAVPWINSKIASSSESYNIISWMGVNGLDASASTGERNATEYFNKYKELAQGSWKNQIIYVVEVGPVQDDLTYYVKTPAVDAFNSKMKSLINSSGISNLRYIDVDYDIKFYDTEGLHYSTSDYQNIYNAIIGKLNRTLSSKKEIYDMKDYCTFYEYAKGGCDSGWWWPIGTGSPVGNIYPEEPDSSLTNLYSPFSTYRELKHRAHLGSDIGGDYDDVVIASKSGTVTYVNNGCPTVGSLNSTCGGGGGNWVKIDHGNGISTVYMHMKLDSIVVKVGDHVSQGQKIGLIGSSGSSTGAHLHFGVSVNETYQDPYKGYIDPNNTRPGGTSCSYSNDKSGICKALKDQGLSDNAVAGLMTNIFAESGFSPALSAPDGNNGRSYGIIMWHNVYSCSSYDVCNAPQSLTCNGSRMQCYCKQNGMEWGTTECQVKYLMKYIEDTAQAGPSWDVRDVLYNNSTAYDVAREFCMKLERPQNASVNCANRAANFASDMLSYVKNDCKD